MAPGGWWSSSPGMSRDRKEVVYYMPSHLSNGVLVLVFTLQAGNHVQSDACAVKIEVCWGLKPAWTFNYGNEFSHRFSKAFVKNEGGVGGSWGARIWGATAPKGSREQQRWLKWGNKLISVTFIWCLILQLLHSLLKIYSHSHECH